ncbi:SDR family oxidoreductase [Thalassospira sp. MCCC 1A01428]|uniref:SDR family oxidoreductase n=1 Tax=Thalassospira sp. MCCC 1A01428 TaxID=1470575 RepID=UPI000A1F3328|nr:SDR family oxidoreductase [Thalassospira sp. MCCC 1A01428]
MLLQDKVVIITGANSGIGAASAKLFAAQGAKLVLGARNVDRLDAVVSEITVAGGEAFALAGDVCDEAFAKALVNAAIGEYGGLDVGFNNAGTLGLPGALVDIEQDDWNQTLCTNLTSAMFGAKHQMPEIAKRGGGSVIFTSTFVGYTIGLPGMTAYAAGKMGLIGMAQCLAVEYGAANVRVNALVPGGTDTPMAASFASDPEARAMVEKFHALGRIAAPEEIAKAALFLASDASSFVTGTAMLADGGNSICKAA